MLSKILIAPDSFKGTMSSIEVCDLIEKGIKNIRPDIETVKVPIADGGEGTVDAFLTAVGGKKVFINAKDPFFRDIKTFYGILKDNKTAVIEMAAVSGLSLVGEHMDPLIASTYGTGQLILDALNRGCKKIIVGIGGSATNDGGIGALAALGARFIDTAGYEIPLNGGGLAGLSRIDITKVDKRIKESEILVACDVSNPLYGPEGAAYVYAPQKGADEVMVKDLDRNLRHYAAVIKDMFGINVQEIPGTGAGGGLGAALAVFAGAVLKSGINIILDAVCFDETLQGVDLVITGEGKIDGQSLRGKVPLGIAERTAQYEIPVIAIVGNIGDNIDDIYKKGISAVFSTMRRPIPFEIAKDSCRDDLLQTTESIIRFASVL